MENESMENRPLFPEESPEREAALKALAQGLETRGPELDALLWEALEAFQNTPFLTAKGLAFSYSIRGGELFFTRKEKSITKATVLMSFHRALELMDEEGEVSGPKRLGTFGASYLYPVFARLGVLRATGRRRRWKK